MGKFAKTTRREWRRRVRQLRLTVTERSPDWARRRLGPMINWLDMLFVDHGIFRLVYFNRHALGARAWRAAQPAPHQIRALAREGVRTIVNLRGARFSGSYWLEQQACRDAGIALVDFQIRSRAAPTREEVLAAKRLFDSIDYPVLIHCKAGADRAGLMSALYLHFRDGLPISQARRELGARFGHVRASDTGILDAFFDAYLAFAEKAPIAFAEWVEAHYDAEALKRDFRPKRWATILNGTVLRRE